MIAQELMRRAEIAEPCTASWEGMTGDDKIRMCAQCNLNVYNAEAMTDEEVMLKIMSLATGNRVCMRIYRRADGTFLTKNCPVGLRKLQEKTRRIAGWLAGGLAMLMSSGAGAKNSCGSDGAPDPNVKKPVWHSKVVADQPNARKKLPAAAQRTAPSVADGGPYAAGGLGPPRYTQEQISAAKVNLVAAEKKYGADSLPIAAQVSQIGMMHYWQNEYPEAEKSYLRALSIYEKQHDKDGARQSCLQLSMLCRMRGDEKGSADWQRKADRDGFEPEKLPR